MGPDMTTPDPTLKPVTKGGIPVHPDGRPRTPTPGAPHQRIVAPSSHTGRHFAELGHAMDHVNRGGGPGSGPMRSTGIRDKIPLKGPRARG